jgi:hypothetical protein
MKKTAFYLISLLALMFVSIGAMAQNTGSSPYLNSTHTYTSAKTVGMTTTMSWSVDGGGTLTQAGNTLSATVLWTATGLHTVTVTELTTDGCSTIRTFPVTVIANPFNLAVTAPGIACATGSGTVIPDLATSPGNTTVVFTVALTGDNSKTSTFDYALSTTTTATFGNVTISNSIYAGANLTGSLTIPSGINSFTVSVVIASRFNIQDLVKLTISNGKDFYGTVENNVLDNEGTATINAIPATTAISTD